MWSTTCAVVNATLVFRPIDGSSRPVHEIVFALVGRTSQLQFYPVFPQIANECAVYFARTHLLCGLAGEGKDRFPSKLFGRALLPACSVSISIPHLSHKSLVDCCCLHSTSLHFTSFMHKYLLLFASLLVGLTAAAVNTDFDSCWKGFYEWKVKNSAE
ncbi:hypothetical protein GQ42DRAFT_27903 [Ramicandelaber brevisporus]|nr:hypothetical protein GQ42DRAFT_27903 [Ramicandelaber brevisporus]